MEQTINKCKKCGHVWNKRIDLPQQCPRCKSYEWQLSMEELRKAVRIDAVALNGALPEGMKE